MEPSSLLANALLKILARPEVIEGVKRRYASLREALLGGGAIIVGGGELGVEIGRAFCELGWHVTVISAGREENPAEGVHSTVAKKPVEFGDGVVISAKKWDASTRIHSYRTEDLAPTLWSIIAEKEPAYVVLEDAFLPAADWEVTEQWPIEGEERPQFIPSSVGDEVASARFLSRSETKDRVGKLIRESIVLDYQTLREAEFRDDEARENAIAKILGAWGGRGYVKPDTTSSGHGVSYVDGPAAVKAAVRMLKKHPRAQVDEFVVERALDPAKTVEAYVFVAKNTRQRENKVVIGPIEYRRHADRAMMYGGPYRLQYAAYPARGIPSDTQSALVSAAEQIADNYAGAFVGVEFLVSGSEYYVNEVTWRPDDIGMVTLLSHQPNQFQLFRDAILGRPLANEDIISSGGPYICKPLLRQDAWPYAPKEQVRGGPGWRLHLYQKGGVPDARGQRVFGYYIADLQEGRSVASVEQAVRLWCQHNLAPGVPEPVAFPQSPAWI